MTLACVLSALVFFAAVFGCGITILCDTSNCDDDDDLGE